VQLLVEFGIVGISPAPFYPKIGIKHKNQKYFDEP